MGLGSVLLLLAVATQPSRAFGAAGEWVAGDGESAQSAEQVYSTEECDPETAALGDYLGATATRPPGELAYPLVNHIALRRSASERPSIEELSPAGVPSSRGTGGRMGAGDARGT